MSFALPLAKAVLPFIGRAAASDAVGLGASSLLGKIFGGERRKRIRYKKLYRKKNLYKRRRKRRR